MKHVPLRIKGKVIAHIPEHIANLLIEHANATKQVSANLSVYKNDKLSPSGSPESFNVTIQIYADTSKPVAMVNTPPMVVRKPSPLKGTKVSVNIDESKSTKKGKV